MALSSRLMEDVFKLFDTHNAGVLNADELTLAMHALGHRPREREIGPQCHVSLQEFKDLMDQRAGPTRDIAEDPTRAFRMFDVDRTGKVSAQNLHHVAQTVGARNDRTQIKSILRYADRDRDGQLNLTEWYAALGLTPHHNPSVVPGSGLSRGSRHLERPTSGVYEPRSTEAPPSTPYRKPQANGVISSPRIPVPGLSLYEYLFGEDAGQSPDRVVFVDANSGRQMPYGQLKDYVGRIAAALTEKGFQQGDVLCMYSPNVTEYPALFHATVALGGTVTAAAAGGTADELYEQMRETGATWVFTITAGAQRVQEVAERLGNVRDIFVLGEPVAGTTPFTHLLRTASLMPTVTIYPKDDVAAILYTSGITGQRKGVRLTHHNLVSSMEQYLAVETDNLFPNDSTIAVLPFHNVYGLQFLMNITIKVAITTVVMVRFDISHFLRLAMHYRITQLAVVPPIARMLLRHPEVLTHDLSSVRCVTVVGASLAGAAEAQLGERLQCRVRQAYGLTEALLTHLNPIRYVRHGCVGLLMPNCTAKLCDLVTGRPITAPNREGELCVLSPTVMTGYVTTGPNDLVIDADGYLHTGDVMRVDPQGYFTLIERMGNLIPGPQGGPPFILPSEWYPAIMSLDTLADAVVIPTSQGPKGYVVPKPGCTVTPAEVQQRIMERMNSRQPLPGGVVVLQGIPKAATGAVIIRLLPGN